MSCFPGASPGAVGHSTPSARRRREERREGGKKVIQDAPDGWESKIGIRGDEKQIKDKIK